MVKVRHHHASNNLHVVANCKTSQKRNLKGLFNLGNTCYLNSSLQCVTRSPYFFELLTSIRVNSATLKKPKDESCTSLQIDLPILKAPVTVRFTEICERLRNRDSEISGRSTVDPGPLRECVLLKYPRFSGFQQQDSHEFLRALLDCLKQEELLRWRRGILNKLNLDLKNVNQHERQLVRSWGRAASRATLVDRLFGGVLVSSFQCTVCNTIRTRFEPFLDLSLSITDTKLSAGQSVNQNLSSNRNDFRKSKQELKRERRQKNKAHRSNRKQRIKDKRENCHFHSSDLDAECPPLDPCGPLDGTAEDVSANHTQLNTCTDRDGISEPLLPDSDLQDRLSVPNRTTELDNFTCEANGYTQESLSSSPVCRSSSRSSNGSCADGEDSEEDNVSPNTIEETTLTTTALSRIENSCVSRNTAQGDCVAVNPTDFLADHLKHIHMDSQEFDSFCADEVTQAVRLAQIPLRPPTRYTSHCSSTSLLSCLARFTAPERLMDSNKLLCESCSIGRKPKEQSDDDSEDRTPSFEKPIYQDFIRRDLILEPPALLTIHFKRFQQFGNHLRKCQNPVAFPVILDLSPFCTTLLLSSCDSVSYRLYGVVEHSGRLAEGHYVAYVAATPEELEDRKSADSVRVNKFVDMFVGALDKPHKWPLNSHDLVRRLRRCDRMQLMKAVSQLENLMLSEEQGPSDFPLHSTDKINPTPETDDRLWFCCSDSHVSQVPLTTVLNSQPFLLFYERIPPE